MNEKRHLNQKYACYRYFTMNNGLYIILLLNIGLVYGDGEPVWDDPALECLPLNEWHKDMTECKYDAAFKTLDVKVNENASNVTLGYINCKNCTAAGSVYIGNFDTGNKALLGAQLPTEAGRKYLEITKPQDYESVEQRKYVFYIHVGQEVARTINLIINDLDDNAPIIKVDQKTCLIMENNVGLSECTYQIHDPDEISDVMQTKISFDDTDIDDMNKIFKVLLRKTNDKLKATGTLNIITSLDYENVSMYIMTMYAKDSAGNTGVAMVTVEVDDDNDMPPRWLHIFATEKFSEETVQDFYISAVDQDIKINATINYKFEEECHKNITINQDTGGIHVNTIDRDILENDFITCLVIAYERDTIAMQVNGTITFLILDINDNAPVITPKDISLIFPETQYRTFEHITGVNDIDLGVNATYTVELVDEQNQKSKWSDAFQMIPSSAYKQWNFSLSIVNPDSLDYEDENWRKFTIKIISQDPDWKCESNIHVELTNRNDEIPKFTENIYKVEVLENATANYKILSIRADDRDFNDSVVYSFTGDYLDESFEINESTGQITTKINNVFNYEKQTQVLIQVQADDTLEVDNEPTHTVFAQVEITVLDVNDEPPRLSLPTEATTIEENKKAGTLVTNKILATDPDTKANLTFRIEWPSSYATKQGSQVDNKYFINVFAIVTKFHDPSKTGSAYAELIVDETEKLDYEIFEVIYLHIIVEDFGQDINNGTDSATLTVTIKDLNDNTPIFVEDTITANMSVEEKSSVKLLIGTILATDNDGPGNNNISYNLSPTSSTPEGLVGIGLKNGELRVTSEEINADEPRFVLTYNVTATDGTNCDTKPIEIMIEDKNDETPVLPDDGLDKTIRVKETTSFMHLRKIKGTDGDRDYPHNLITYTLNPMGSGNLMHLFRIDNNTGDIFVDVDKNGGYVLDRDYGPKSYDIYVTLRDNVGYPGFSNVAENYTFTVELQDINNKIPKLPNIKITDIYQNIEPGAEIARIRAVDDDELGNDNTKIKYSITNITNELDEIVENIFTIETEEVEKVYYDGVLKASGSFEEYYGIFNIHICATDFGEEPLKDSKSYTIQIIPYNFKNPSILYPKEGQKIILDKEQRIGQPLQTVDGDTLEPFRATDNQHEKFSIKFEIVNKNFEDTIFDFHKQANNKAVLILKSEPDTNKIYNLKIRASHNGFGNALNNAECEFRIYFVNPLDNPKFEGETEVIRTFFENQATDCSPIPKATDHKCFTFADCHPIYYYIVPNVDAFTIKATNPEVPEVCVISKLDREHVEYYYLNVIASNIEKPPDTIVNFSPLNLTIIVLDVNDNPPVFNRSLFSGSMTSKDSATRTVLELEATDPDSLDEGKLKYFIEYDTINISDASLADYKQKPFVIENKKNIQSTFKPQKDTKGFFIFRVRVEDSIGGKDHQAFAYVKIYIISDSDRIPFKFKNVVKKVTDEKHFIEEVFSGILVYKCTIDDIDKATIDGEISDDQTVVMTHFIDEGKHESVGKEVIVYNTSNTETVSKLGREFRSRGLDFYDILGDPDVPESMEDLLRTLLIIISVVLGTLCVVLSIAFIIRTRSWNRRINALTTNVFGSTKSDLNRIGTHVPGTNKHAIEANPVWNENLNNVTQFDTVSQGSGGSDLIGIEDNLEFQYSPDDRRASTNPVIQDQMRRRSINPMAAVSTSHDFDNTMF